MNKRKKYVEKCFMSKKKLQHEKKKKYTDKLPTHFNQKNYNLF